MNILGIDPGLGGAIAIYNAAAPHLIAVWDMPVVNGSVDAANLAALLRGQEIHGAVIELVGAMPKQGVSSTFKFGVGYGIAQGVVATLSVPVHFVTPAKWKRHYGLSSDKEASRARAIHLWPVCADAFKRKKDEARAEAALIAKYGVDVMSLGALAA